LEVNFNNENFFNTSEERSVDRLYLPPEECGGWALARLQKGGGLTPTSCRETLVFAVEGGTGVRLSEE
jgi:hypothetical protein